MLQGGAVVRAHCLLGRAGQGNCLCTIVHLRGTVCIAALALQQRADVQRPDVDVGQVLSRRLQRSSIQQLVMYVRKAEHLAAVMHGMRAASVPLELHSTCTKAVLQAGDALNVKQSSECGTCSSSRQAAMRAQMSWSMLNSTICATLSPCTSAQHDVFVRQPQPPSL